jgi:hypothetical protein
MKHRAVFSGVCLLLVGVSCGGQTRNYLGTPPAGEAGMAGDEDSDAAGSSGKSGGGSGGETPNTAGDAGSDQIGGEGGLVEAGAAGANVGGANAGTANTGGASAGTASAGMGGGGANAGGGGGTPGACNDVPHLALPVTFVDSTSAAPTLTSGTIQVGTYVETGLTYYGTGLPAPTAGDGTTLVINVVGSIATLQFDELDLDMTSPETWTIVTGQPNSGPPQSVTVTCAPLDAPLQGANITKYASYQVTNSELLLRFDGLENSSGPISEVFAFHRQTTP